MKKEPIVDLKEFRKKYSITQEEAATAIGIDQRQWSRYEQGHNDIPVRYITAICNTFNHSADELLKLKRNKENQMRKKLNSEEKRSVIIGIKVKPEVKEKLIYLSEADKTQLSTYINNILENHIKIITNIGKIDWDKVIKAYKDNKEK